VTWLRFGLWMLAGLLIYLVYGRTHSRLQRGLDPRKA
jgi:APA family basic amino acid/polyamine antiporter